MRSSASRVLAVFAIVTVWVFCAPVAVVAAPAFTVISPQEGATLAVAPSSIEFNAVDSGGLPGYCAVSLDGRGVRARVSQSSGSTVRVVAPVAGVKNGTHLVRARVYDADFQEHVRDWTFRVAVPVTAGDLVPPDGSIVFDTRPTVSAQLSANGPVATILTVDGVVVPASYNSLTGVFSGRPPAPLTDDDLHVAAVFATDAATGVLTHVEWDFTVAPTSPVAFSGMAPGPGDTVSSADVIVQVRCQEPSGVTSSTVAVDGVALPTLILGPPADRVVSVLASELEDGVHAVSARVVDGMGRSGRTSWSFEVSSPPTIEDLAPAGGHVFTASEADFSATVRDNGSVATVTALVDGTPVADVDFDAVTGRVSIGCSLPAGTGYTLTLLATDDGGRIGSASAVFDVAPPVQTPDCTSCHIDYDRGGHLFAACDTCHGSGGLVADIAHNWSGCNGTCHSRIVIKDCRFGGCHEYTSTTHRPDAFVSNPDGRVWSCLECHVDKSTGHGTGSGAGHTSRESCLSSCHEVDLKVEHLASAPALVCADCHAVRPPAWGGDCSECHQTISHINASHLATDAAVLAARNTRGQSCSDTSVAPNWGCHSLADISLLHRDMAGGGCDLCHGVGRVPAAECKACHSAKGTAGYSAVRIAYPTSDATHSAPYTVAPTGATTVWDKVDDPAANTTDYVTTSGGGRILLASSQLPALPASATVTDVRVMYRALYVNAATTMVPAAAPSLVVGGIAYDKPMQNLTTGWVTYGSVAASIFATNPATGQAWTADEVRGVGASALEAFGVAVNNASPRIARFTQAYLQVSFSVPQLTAPAATTDLYHHNNNVYLLDETDATQSYFYPGLYPPGGWSALYYQRCNDGCHRSFVGPAWSAFAGTAMWYSLAGQTQGIAETRTLTLDAGTLPEAATMSFKTRWQFQATGTATGTVEVSTDGGSSWAVMSGMVHGLERSVLATNSPASWGDASYDLSAFAGRDALVRFRYNLGGNNTGAGWAIDNLTLSGSSGVVFSDDCETLKPQWTSHQWFRERNAYTKY